MAQVLLYIRYVTVVVDVRKVWRCFGFKGTSPSDAVAKNTRGYTATA